MFSPFTCMFMYSYQANSHLASVCCTYYLLDKRSYCNLLICSFFLSFHLTVRQHWWLSIVLSPVYVPEYTSQERKAIVQKNVSSHRWRPGVSRTIVQLSCRPCDAGEVVHQALQENDVTFHLVTKHKVIMAGPDSKKREAMAKKLLGFDNKFGYTVRGEILLSLHPSTSHLQGLKALCPGTKR